MPAGFDKCLKEGGKIKTRTIGKIKFQRICIIDGKSFPGEVKTKKKK